MRERNYQTCRLLLLTDVIHYLVTSVAYRRTHLLRRVGVHVAVSHIAVSHFAGAHVDK